MWTQVSLNNALKAFLEGRDVRIWEEDTVKSLSEVLSEIPDSVVFLVDKDTKQPSQDIPMDKLVEFVVDGPPDEESSAEEPEEPEPEPDPPPKASRAKKQLEEAEKNFQKRKITDIGKLRACREAGWPLKKLAEEFGCSEATVYNTMKREGIE